jgi:hypothetical protein
MLAQVRQEVLPTMQKHGPVVAWIEDDTGFPKQGKHSVGVARQYLRSSGQTGQLPGGREFVGEHLECESADRLAAVPARGVAPGRQAQPAGWGSRRSGV